jgi:hypothetical protein
MKTAFSIVVSFAAVFALTSIAPERAAAAASPGPQPQCYQASPADNQSAFARSGMRRR